MKADCLMLAVYQEEGLKVASFYPDILSKRDTKRILNAALPLNSTEGDFLQGNLGKYTYASYIFFIQGENIHYLSAFIAIFKKDNLQADNINELLESLVAKARKENIVSIKDYTENIPHFHQDLITGSFVFKSTTTVTLSIDTPKKKKKSSSLDTIESFGNDIWLESKLNEENNEEVDEKNQKEETEVNVEIEDE